MRYISSAIRNPIGRMLTTTSASVWRTTWRPVEAPSGPSTESIGNPPRA